MRDNRFCAAAKRRTHAACIGYVFISWAPVYGSTKFSEWFTMTCV